MPLLQYIATRDLSSTLMSYPITRTICKNKGKLIKAPAGAADITKMSRCLVLNMVFAPGFGK